MITLILLSFTNIIHLSNPFANNKFTDILMLVTAGYLDYIGKNKAEEVSSEITNQEEMASSPNAVLLDLSLFVFLFLSHLNIQFLLMYLFLL